MIGSGTEVADADNGAIRHKYRREATDSRQILFVMPPKKEKANKGKKSKETYGNDPAISPTLGPSSLFFTSVSESTLAPITSSIIMPAHISSALSTLPLDRGEASDRGDDSQGSPATGLGSAPSTLTEEGRTNTTDDGIVLARRSGPDSDSDFSVVERSSASPPPSASPPQESLGLDVYIRKRQALLEVLNQLHSTGSVALTSTDKGVIC